MNKDNDFISLADAEINCKLHEYEEYVDSIDFIQMVYDDEDFFSIERCAYFQPTVSDNSGRDIVDSFTAVAVRTKNGHVFCDIHPFSPDDDKPFYTLTPPFTMDDLSIPENIDEQELYERLAETIISHEDTKKDIMNQAPSEYFSNDEAFGYDIHIVYIGSKEDCPFDLSSL